MSVLVIAEHDNSELKGCTKNTVTAALQLATEVTIAVIGANCTDVANTAAGISGVTNVILVDNENYRHQLAENVSELVVEMASAYDFIVAPATTTGKNLLPRVAALLDVQAISDVISVESTDTFKRPIYAGNVIATVKSSDAKKVLIIRATAFDPAEEKGSASIENLDSVYEAQSSEFVREELAKSERPELTSAEVVISGGRGLQSGENFELLFTLADKLGAGVGASRAAVDAGYVPNDMQVGQTGKIVAPNLYIAVGISGAIQHLAGMKDSKVIVAINKDEDAPIFQVADYGLVADLFDVIPELTEKLG